MAGHGRHSGIQVKSVAPGELGIRAQTHRLYSLFKRPAPAGILAAALAFATAALLIAPEHAGAAPPTAGAGAGAATAPAAPQTHVPVTLFGQPCTLKGPLDQKTLKAVHAISPEQIVPPFTSSRTTEQTRRAIEQLKTVTGLPSGLDRYRDQLTAELKAQFAFLAGLDLARKAGNGAPLVTAARPYLKPSKQKDFEALAAKFTGKSSPQQASLLEQLFDFYADAATPDPNASPDSGTSEEEFHRAIRRLGIEYACNFDVEDSTGADAPDE